MIKTSGKRELGQLIAAYLDIKTMDIEQMYFKDDDLDTLVIMDDEVAEKHKEYEALNEEDIHTLITVFTPEHERVFKLIDASLELGDLVSYLALPKEVFEEENQVFQEAVELMKTGENVCQNCSRKCRGTN